MSEWQSIETAKGVKALESVLLYGKYLGRKDPFHVTVGNKSWDVVNKTFGPWYAQGMTFIPTHWMPLPAPPKEE